MFKQDFLNSLPKDSAKAADAICKEFRDRDESVPDDRRTSHYEKYVEAFAVMESFTDSFGISLSFPELGDDILENIDSIRTFFKEAEESVGRLLAKLVLQQAREKYRGRFGRGFAYNFSMGDFTQIRSLLAECLEILELNESCERSLKQRTIKKLELAQDSLQKKMWNLDCLWGLLGDAGVLVGKCGKDAQPVVSRIKEITQITWRTQARSEELPSGSKFPILAC